MIDSAALRTITGAVFRANPDYEIVLIDRMPEEYRRQFQAEADKDPALHGVLWPTENKGLSPKTLCHETALLLHSLRQPGSLPAYVRTRLGSGCNQAIAELVLDGVLELATGPDAPFVSGPAAHGLIYQDEAIELGSGRISVLSREALRYGQLLRVDGVAELSSRLYAYNTIPITSAWRERLPTLAAVEDFLGVRGDAATSRSLERHWARLDEREGSEGWIMWRRREPRCAGTRWATVRQCKLYLSPSADALPRFWPVIVELFARCQVAAFKVGRDVSGLLRPDKIVAYPDSFEQLAALAATLQEHLQDCPAQGTPFTAGIDDAGLLSWGMDPPGEDRMPGSSLPESWRLWVTNRLAVALVTAKSAPGDIEPWQFALRRLSIEGVDIKTWAPARQVRDETRSI